MENSPFTTIGDEPIEARIVAWVLGEASAFEAAELERLCEERPELLVFRRRMRALHGLLTEAEATQPDEGWKLPPEKRQALDEVFGAEKPVAEDPVIEKRIRHSGRRAFLAIAACLILTVVVAGLTAPMVMRQRKKADMVRSIEYRHSGMEPLATNLPPELIEGTPKPINVPNLEVPRNGPAGWSSRGLASEPLAKNPSESASSNAMPESRKPGESSEITAGFAGGRTLDELKAKKLAMPDRPEAKQRVFAAAETPRPALAPVDGFASLAPSAQPPVATIPPSPAAPNAKPRVVPPTEADEKLAQSDAPAGPQVAVKTKSVEDPFADESVFSSRLAPQKQLAKSGSGTLNVPSDIGGGSGGGPPMPPGQDLAASNSKDQISKVDADDRTRNREELDDRLSIEGKRSLPVEKNLDPTDKIPVLGDVPIMGRLFAEGDKSESAANLDLYGTNTYNGGTSLNAGALGGGGVEKDAPDSSSPLRSNAAQSFSRDSAFTNPDGTKKSMFLPKITTRSVGEDVESREDSNSASPAAGKPASADDMTKGKDGPIEIEGFVNPIGIEGFVNYGTPIEDGRNRSGDSSVRQPVFPAESAPPVLPDSTSAAPFPATPATPDVFWDTSGAGKKTGGVEYEINTGYRSEYLFRGSDLNGSGVLSDSARGGPKSNESDLAQREMIRRQLIDLDEETDAAKEITETEGQSKLEARIEDFKAIRDQENVVEEKRKTLATLARSKGIIYEGTENEEAIKRGLDAQDYVDAKRDFEKDQELLQQMKLKRSGATAAPEPEKPKPNLAELMEEIVATEDPYSTFSLNISDASFQVAQAALAKGERPDPAGIKVEQFYNAVDYGDPAPTAGEPVAHAIEQSAHPFIPGRNLVRVALKTGSAGRTASQPLRLTLLVDQSGSMVREDRRAAMDKALAGLAGLLTKNDLVNVIGFSRTPRLLADGWTGDQAGKLAELVNQTASEGGTNLEEAINLAEQLADRRKLAGAQNRIVLFTDGAANLGNADPVRLAEKVKTLRQKGIAFDIAGIAADGLNDELLGELARNGNGRYYVVGKGPDENLAKQLAGAFRPAAENVKVQVHFNPERVGRYKLIGFEKDRLKTEDFRNDSVDAAELAAEEAGVAVYQIEPLPNGSGELGEVSVRFRDTAKGEMVERTWTIPYDSNAPAFDRATPSMQLAVLSMLAAEKLRGGPLAEAIDFRQLSQTRANVKQFYGNSGRVAEVLRMIDSLQ